MVKAARKSLQRIETTNLSGIIVEYVASNATDWFRYSKSRYSRLRASRKYRYRVQTLLDHRREFPPRCSILGRDSNTILLEWLS